MLKEIEAEHRYVLGTQNGYSHNAAGLAYENVSGISDSAGGVPLKIFGKMLAFPENSWYSYVL